jgi:iron(III) transport system substrate-binding protein
MKRIKVLAVGAVVALTAAACGGGDPEEAAGTDAPAGAAEEEISAGGCLPESDPLVEEARKEGSVVMSGPPDDRVRQILPAAFQDAYGVSLEYKGGRGSELAAKLKEERAAGIYSQDVFVGGGDTMTNVYLKSGWLAPLDDLVPEEALGGSEWVRGEVPWIDAGHHILKLSEYVALPYVINTDQVDPEEVASWQDLADPKWRGKIVMGDPRASGGGANDIGMFIETEGYGESFVQALYVDQEPVFLEDDRGMVDGLAQGKYLIGLSINQADVDQGISDGLPLEVVMPEDGPHQVTSGYGLLAVADQAPHPKAAQLLASWLACADGNAAWNEAYNTYSTRADVPPPADVPEYQEVKGDVEYFDTYSWEFLTEGKPAAKAKMKELLG